MKFIKIKISIIIVTILLVFSTLTTTQSQYAPDNNVNWIELSAIGTIDINGNSVLASYASSGTGSASDPYLLDTSLFTDYYVNISNTDAYFIFSGWTVQDFSGDNQSRITLTDVSNAVITSNLVDFTYYGFTVIRGNNINITNNFIYSVYFGIELGGVVNSVIANNTIVAPNAIYFSYVEREYAAINSGSRVPSQNLIIADNAILNGGINPLFPLKYSPDMVFDYKLENNTHYYGDYLFSQEIDWGSFDTGYVHIVENVSSIDIRNEGLSLLIARNISGDVHLENLTLYANIQVTNASSVIMKDVVSSVDYNYGMLSTGILFKEIPDVTMIENNITNMIQWLVYSRYDNYQSNDTDLPTYYDFFAFYIDIRNSSNIHIEDNVIDTEGFGTLMRLLGSNNSIIKNNDFLIPVTTTNTNQFFLLFQDSGNSTLTNNYFYTNDEYVNTQFYVFKDQDITFSSNYYSWLPSNYNDTDGDGYIDEEFRVSGDWFWDPSTEVYDPHPLSKFNDILNFTIVSPNNSGNEVSGSIDLEWDADVTRSYPVNFTLYHLEGSTWVEVGRVTDLYSMSLDTAAYADGVSQFRLNATTNYPFLNITNTRSLQFELEINNTDDDTSDPTDPDDDGEPEDTTPPSDSEPVDGESGLLDLPIGLFFSGIIGFQLVYRSKFRRKIS